MIPIPTTVQQKLAGKLLYTGAIDGALGPLSLRALMAVAAARKSLLDVDFDLAKALYGALLQADIDNRLRVLHCLAQTAVETSYWTRVTEIGSSAHFADYDGRYGNRAGEGYLFRGRGFVQLTFRANYEDAAKATGHDLAALPNQAAEPEIAADVLAWYWTSRHCNAAADANDLTLVTKRVNGGQNGLDDRRTVLNRLTAVWPSNTPAAKAA